MESANVNGTAITYKYNADGLRTEKTVGSTVSKYEYTGDMLFYEKRGDLEFHYRYDAFGNVASITRVKADGTSFSLYTVCNSRGDVEELRRSTGELFARYVYDSWGNVLHIYDASGAEITSTANFAVQNPFRYRGYYYDNETGLYYVGSRYYDPVTHRFVNADTSDVLSVTPMGLTDKNLFAYCDNNPVTRSDNGGQFWNVVIGAVVGAVAGIVGQIISDTVTSVLNGEITISNWQTYTGATVGGAAGGVVLATTGNMNAANAVTGAATTGVGQSLEKLTISNYNKSWAEIGVNAAVDGVVSFGLGKLPGIKGATAGRNSWSAVYKSGLTKLRNGTATRMSAKVVAKGLGASIVGGFALDAYYGVKQHAYDRIKSWFN